MNQENRPNPDELLKAIQTEENKMGRLKIFLGMAAGVGKTYAMLREAQNLQKAGVDVVIGLIDTHDRIETMELVKGLPLIPEKVVIYKEKEFKELDLDEIIRIKPKVVLIDELAHSNIPGLRHEKRWQDVLEVLENGIDVYTTLNVQHIESLKDIVENITGITIKETVPDLIIERAAFIQVVDLIPDELLKRLDSGKVYLGDQPKIASLHFFKEDKLTALREILLRYTAEKIDYDLHHMVSIVEKENKWRPREKLLVALSPSPHSQKLIRTTRRLAATLEAPWIGVYVDTGKTLNESDEIMLDKNLSLARDLGAEVITTYDPDVAVAIERIARRRGVTQIIVGRSPTTFFHFFNRFNLLEKLAKACTDIDIHLIRQETLLTKNKKKLTLTFKKNQYSSYFLVFLAVCALALLALGALPFIGYIAVGETFFIGILALSLFFKRGPIFFAALLFSLIWYFFFIPMEFQSSIQSLLLPAIYFFAAIATGILIDRYREHQEMLAKREEKSQSLYRILRQIATTRSTERLFKEVEEYLEKIFNTPFEILMEEGLHEGLNFKKTNSLIFNEKEKAAAIWVFENEKEAGWSADTLPSCENLYIPMKGFQETVGILVCKKKLRFLNLDEKNFLYTVAQQLGYHLERSFLEERSRQNALLIQIEKINRNILNRISNEFIPIAKETKESLKAFKETLNTVHNKALNDEFFKVEKSFEKLSKKMKHISLMTDVKKE